MEEEFNKCPKCGEWHIEEKVCRACNTKLNDPNDTSIRIGKCPSCNRKTNLVVVSCEFCGIVFQKWQLRKDQEAIRATETENSPPADSVIEIKPKTKLEKIFHWVIKHYIITLVIVIGLPIFIFLYPYIFPPKKEFSSDRYNFSFKYPKDWVVSKLDETDEPSNILLTLKKGYFGYAYMQIIAVDLSMYKREYALEKVENLDISNLRDDEIRLLHLMHSQMMLMVENPKDTALLKFGSTNFAGKELGDVSFLMNMEGNQKVFFRMLASYSYGNVETLAIIIVCPEAFMDTIEEDIEYMEENWLWYD